MWPNGYRGTRGIKFVEFPVRFLALSIYGEEVVIVREKSGSPFPVKRYSIVSWEHELKEELLPAPSSGVGLRNWSWS